jgi:hypothetical protein
MDADVRHQILSHAGRAGIKLRLAGMSEADKAAMTAKARAAAAAKYLERVKVEIDPDGAMPADERERRARNLIEARAAKAEADRIRREYNQRLLAVEADEFGDLVAAMHSQAQ